MLEETDTAGQTAAVVALAKLGDDAALPVAREWMKKGDPGQRRAAAEVLISLDAPDAPAAVALLLENEATREDGLRLALLAPAPALAAPLAKVLPALLEDQRGRAVAALGRAGGVALLAPLVDKPETALAAAFALAIALPGDEGARARWSRRSPRRQGEDGGRAAAPVAGRAWCARWCSTIRPRG